MLLSQKDVTGLRKLLVTALDGGVSPQELLDILERAVNGTYAGLVRALEALDLCLFALTKSHGPVSIRTVDRHFKVPQNHFIPTGISPRFKVDRLELLER